MYSTSDFKKGLKILIDEEPYTIVDFQHVKPGKGNQFTRTKLKNSLNRWKSGAQPLNRVKSSVFQMLNTKISIFSILTREGLFYGPGDLDQVALNRELLVIMSIFSQKISE